MSQSNLDLGAARNTAKDSLYVAVGFAVLALQKAKVRRRELSESLNKSGGFPRSQLAAGMTAFENNLAALDTRIEELEGKLDQAVASIDKVLPGTLGATVTHAHYVARSARKHLRTLVLSAS